MGIFGISSDKYCFSMKSGPIKNEFEYFQLRNFSKLVVTAFCFSEKLYCLKIMAIFGGKSIEKLCKFHAVILLSETLPERDLEKTRILGINETKQTTQFSFSRSVLTNFSNKIAVFTDIFTRCLQKSLLKHQNQ